MDFARTDLGWICSWCMVVGAWQVMHVEELSEQEWIQDAGKKCLFDVVLVRGVGW